MGEGRQTKIVVKWKGKCHKQSGIEGGIENLRAEESTSRAAVMVDIYNPFSNMLKFYIAVSRKITMVTGDRRKSDFGHILQLFISISMINKLTAQFKPHRFKFYIIILELGRFFRKYNLEGIIFFSWTFSK